LRNRAGLTALFCASMFKEKHMAHDQAVGRPHPIHDEIFGKDPDGFVNDTPPGAIGERVNIIGIAAQPERNQPMRGVGDTDQGDRQPDGDRRR
jgi:hypothetical protein